MRVYNLCRAAETHFSKVQALTTSNRRFFQQDAGLQLPDVPVTEVPAWDLRRLSGFRASSGNATFVSSDLKHSFWGRMLRQLVDSFPFNILLGDGGLVYIVKGYRAGKKLVSSAGITHLFSTFRPYSDHIIAYLLKKRFPELIWIADFRDLHLDEKHGRQLFFWPLQVWANRMVLARADRVTTVSQGLAEKLEPFAAGITVLRNGIPPSSGRSTAHSHPFFSIVYTGRIYPTEQTALLLFEVLQDLITAGKLDPGVLQLSYAGPTPESWEAWALQTNLSDLLDMHGLVSLQKARQLQNRSAVNLLLAFSSPGQKGDLSSKVYEYLAGGNAVLAIINGEKDLEFEAFFDHLEPGLLVYHHPQYRQAIEQFILDRYQAWQLQQIEVWPKKQEAAKAYRTEELFGAFFAEYF